MLERILLALNGQVKPSLRARILFALCTAALGSLLCYANHLTPWSRPGDFGQNWFAARAMIGGSDPYSLVGPHLAYDWPWPLFYPATSFVVALPFTVLPLLWATVAFTFVSCGLLGFSITQRGWFLAPMLGSAPFIFAAGSAQWSPLLTAALGLPAIAFVFAAKPTIGAALAIAGNSRVRLFALSGAVILGVISILALPGWIENWLESVAMGKHILPPLLRFGGPAILVALLRWKRADARLILAMACVPQTGAWYEALPLFLVAKNYRETLILSMTSSLGFLSYYRFMDAGSDIKVNHDVGALIVACVYLPAVIMVLNRPNALSKLSVSSP